MKMRMRISRPLLFIAIICSLSSVAPATTEQLRQWIQSNKQTIQSLPRSAQELVESASESDLASTILRIFGFNVDRSEKTTTSTTSTQSTTTPKSGVPVSERDVCPFNADPLILSGEYAYCKPSSLGDCPIGFVCDQSFVLGRSICCQDLRHRPGVIHGRGHGIIPTSVRPPMSWNTVTPSRATQRWTQYPTNDIKTTKRAPWYIKDRLDSLYQKFQAYQALYNLYDALDVDKNRERLLEMLDIGLRTPWTPKYKPSALPEVVTPVTTTDEDLTTTTAAPTYVYSSTTERQTPLISHFSTTSKPVNPWARLWTTTGAPRNFVNVSVLQAGSIRNLKDNQMEMVGAITLINDNGIHVLVDTGASSDTERLLHNLSKEQITLDEIDTVVITHGHPGHMGNMNFFGQKPILYHTLEFIGRHVTPTELKERPYRKLSNNIEVWKTPGHTQHDLSVLVHNVQGYGSMAIVGDLIPNEQLISEKIDVMAEEGVWDAAIKRQNANLIICMADWVIPGHGQPFRVLPQYRQKAGCTRLLAQRHILNTRVLQQ